MARAKPWFGWGMASYPHAFRLFDTHVSREDGLPTFYRDAHSDWLQAFAEHGFVGSALLALCAALPLARLRPHHLRSPLTAYLLSGCALLLLYAWVEFPFGNLAVVFVWWLGLFSAAQYARLQDRENAAAARAAGPTVPA
jgi:O-antigen ligase